MIHPQNTEHAEELIYNIDFKIGCFLSEYEKYFGYKKASRLLTFQFENYTLDKSIESQDYWIMKSNSENDLYNFAFKQVMSELRYRFLCPGFIPVGSKVFVPKYGVCRSLHVEWGVIAFETESGIIDSSDIAYPLNHQVALENNIEVDVGGVIIYKNELWKIIKVEKFNDVLNCIIDIERIEDEGVYLDLKKFDIVKMRDVFIPTFWSDGKTEHPVANSIFEIFSV